MIVYLHDFNQLLSIINFLIKTNTTFTFEYTLHILHHPIIVHSWSIGIKLRQKSSIL